MRAAIVALLLAATWRGAVVATRSGTTARISILDVGQGDAILVEGSRGGRLLVDGGPDPDRLLVALDRRIPPWDRRIDAVILSHPHEDHVAGLALLLERYHVGRVFEPGMRGPGPGYAAWLRRLAEPSAPTRLAIAAGDRLAVDEIGLDVLWPIRGRVPIEPPDGGTGINNVSVVLLGDVGGRRFLLMGDVEEGIDPSLLADGLPHVELLKVAHHGSRTATTQAFVDAVHPRVAVASAGAGNPYGHPAASTMERLAASGARVLRTDRDGTVVVAFETDGMTVRTEGGRATARTSAALAVTAARAATVATAADRAVAYLCAIPVTGLVPDRERAPAADTVASFGTPDWSDRDPGRNAVVGYHRGDDGAWAGGSRLPAALPRPTTLARTARARRGRGRRVAGGPDRGQRNADRPPTGRVRGPAPRCRQGAPGRRSGARPPPRRRVGGVADAGRTSGTRPCGRGPPGDPPGRRRAASTLGGVRDTRGTDRRLRRQAGGPTPRVDGRAVRRRGAGATRAAGTRPRSRAVRARADRLEADVCRAAGVDTRRGPPTGMDRARPAYRPPTPTMTTAPLAFFWGDDELTAARALDRFEAALEAESGAPMDRWLLRGERNTATGLIADLLERVATPVMFGGGTLAIVTNAGALVVKGEDRDAFLAAMTVVAPGNALVILDASQSGAKGPTPKRVADAVAAAGGTVRRFESPRGGALAGWIEAEARERGLTLGPGAAKLLAERIGGFVQEGDVERRHQTRLASMELDKLALYRGNAPIGPEDVRALVAEAVPTSVWVFTDAVGERQVDRALAMLDRLIESTPEPVLLAVLHRRVRELLELGDRLAAGERLATAAKAMGIASEYRARTLSGQAKAWTTAELTAALDGLVELDALVKGVPGSDAGEAQRRLAFGLWVMDHAGTRPATECLTVSRRTTRPAPGRRGRSRSRRRSGLRRGRAAR